MAKETYPTALRDVLVYEGGYVNHPKDPGGATNKGITQATYDAWRMRNNKLRRSVKSIDMNEVEAIYRAGYWDKVRADALPAGPDYATFDGAVNSGPSRGAKWLQAAIGATADGAVGPATLLAAAKAPDKAAVVRKMCALRMGFLRSLGTWLTFGKGWSRRVAAVEVAGVRLALAAAGVSPPAIAAEAAAEAKAAEGEVKKADTGAAATGTGGVAGGVGAETAGDQVVSLILLGAIGIAIVVVVFFVVRGRWQRDRRDAYRKAAQGV